MDIFVPVVLLCLLGVVVGYSQKITPDSKETLSRTKKDLDPDGLAGD